MLTELRIYLFQNRITQKKLAEAAGVSPGFVTLVMYGDRRFSKEQVELIRKRFPRIPRRLLFDKAA